MRTSISKTIFAALLLVGGVTLSGATEGKGTKDPAFDAAYSIAASIPTNTVAGVDVGAIVVPGLTSKLREDETPEDRGVVLSFADSAGDVRAVVRFAVTHTPAEARSFLDRELHAVARILPEAKNPALGDLAYADDGVGEVYVAGTIANVAYVVRTIPNPNAPGAIPSARSIAIDLHAKVVSGTPTFPTPAVAIPHDFSAKDGAPITSSAPPGQALHLRAENAYVAHGALGPIVRPFAPGKVAVIAIVVDELGRVGVARAEGTAK